MLIAPRLLRVRDKNRLAFENKLCFITVTWYLLYSICSFQTNDFETPHSCELRFLHANAQLLNTSVFMTAIVCTKFTIGCSISHAC